MENTGLLMTSDRSVSRVTVSSPQVLHVRDGCPTGNATFRVIPRVLPSPSEPSPSQPQMVLTLHSPKKATSSLEFKYQLAGNGTVSPTQSGQRLVESTFSPSQSPVNESSVNDCEPMSSMTGQTQDMDSSGNDLHDEKLSVAADSNSHKQPFVACKVCGDKASGYHYGVTSCEGCKGFFRRSIQKQIEYRCLRDGKCLVMRLNRNRCQYCRFKKCLAVGMSRDSVRYGRVPKRSKSQDEQRVTTTGDQEEINSLESKQLAIYDIILTTSQAHHANCAYTEDKIKNLSRNVTSLLPKIKTEADLADDHRCPMFENMAHLITPSIQEVVEFAKRMPGFHELPQDDQLILIKTGFFEIWLARVARMFSTAENMITFGDGSVVPKEELQVIFTTELVADMFIFAASFSQLQLNDTEVGLFTGVVLATSDRPNLSNVKAVENIQEQLIEALKLQISRNHGAEPNLFNSMLMKIPELRTVGRKHADQLAWFRDRWFLMRLPPLFAEIYDIQKLDDEDDEEEVQT